MNRTIIVLTVVALLSGWTGSTHAWIITTEGDQHVITTDPALLHSVHDALEAAGVNVSDAEIGMIPQNSVVVEGKDAERLLRLTDALEDDDDVSKVFSNFDIDQDTLAAVGG